MKSRPKKRTPNIVNLTVNRRYLTEREVERLMNRARKHSRHGHRDATMILVAYRHACGPRRSATCNGSRSSYPKAACTFTGSRTAFPAYIRSAVTKCGLCVSYGAIIPTTPTSIGPIGFHRLIQRVGEAAKMPFPIHPQMLRHACGFKHANDGHDTRALQHYLGHKNI